MRQSRKLAVPAVITTAAMLTAGCSGALAATSKTKHPWQAVAGQFKTKTAAKAEVTTLRGKGLKGYKVETEKKGQFTGGQKYEVEKSVTSKKKATAAVKKLTKAGVTGATIEKEKTEKA
jgi:hypothetical protein